MQLTGAEIICECLLEQGVDTVFGYPGGAALNTYDALYKYSDRINHVLTAHEQGASHAADGYARATGKTGVVMTTSGPGATNMITGIATAYSDSIPVICITGQVKRELLGRDVFQEADITGACEPFVKHSYLVNDTKDLPRVFKEAFHIATTGRMGPVLIDIPQDVQEEEIESFEYPDSVDIVGYKPNVRGHKMQIKKAIDLIKEAERPLIVAGGGVLSSGSKLKLQQFAEMTGIPVISTLMGIGVMPSEHMRYLGMLGTHGKKYANMALHESDLLIVCGARLGDRAVAKPDQVSRTSKIIHIDIDPAEIGKNVRTTVPIVGDMKNVIEKLIDEKCVLVNGKEVKASYKVCLNDEIEINDTLKKESDIKPVKMQLNIVYEDDDLMIINKPSGLVVHPGAGNYDNTLVNGLLNYTNNLSSVDDVRPGIVHRLDKDTSGLMVVAKNNKCHELLSEMFKNHEVKRTYYALVCGVVPYNKGTVDVPLKKDETKFDRVCASEDGKKAITHFTVLKRYNDYTLLSLNLETGRTHQIRVHMAYMGYPVYNDPVYNNRKATEFGQFLHSKEIDFIHPISGKRLHFECELPKEFKDFIDNLK